MSTPQQVQYQHQAAPQLATVVNNDEEMGIGNPSILSKSRPIGQSIPTSVMKVTLPSNATTTYGSTGNCADSNSSSTTMQLPAQSSLLSSSSSAVQMVPGLAPLPADPIRRMVAVRYFLDRPGHGLHNATVRLWMDPPTVCVPSDLHHFLLTCGIIPGDDGTPLLQSTNNGFEAIDYDNFLIEVYLDTFQAFMLLQACEDAEIEWNLSDSTIQQPGSFNVRLSDLSFHHHHHDHHHHHQESHPHEMITKTVTPPVGTSVNANTTPVGLFSFAFMIGLETAFAMERLMKDFSFGIDPAYVVTWGPYMVFSGGGLMWITGILQVFRNNIYGAVAFLVFGSFWFANGTKVILETHFSGPGTKAYEFQQLDKYHDPWGSMIRLLYTMGFVLVLLSSTFAGSKVSTCLMGLLICKFICQIGAAWSDVAGWLQVFFGWLVSWLAFYVFIVEMTNQVYHREVFNLHKWSEDHSPGEIFGQPGNGHHTLYSKTQRQFKRSFSNITKVRMTLHRSASSIFNKGKKSN